MDKIKTRIHLSVSKLTPRARVRAVRLYRNVPHVREPRSVLLRVGGGGARDDVCSAGRKPRGAAAWRQWPLIHKHEPYISAFHPALRQKLLTVNLNILNFFKEEAQLADTLEKRKGPV